MGHRPALEHASRTRNHRPARRCRRKAREMTDLLSKFDALIAEREALLDSGVRDPFSLVMEKVNSPTEAIISGKPTLLLGTYNYMGMTFDPDVIAAGKTALDEFGSGTTGSREIGRAHVCTPVTNAHLVCRLLLEKKKLTHQS